MRMFRFICTWSHAACRLQALRQPPAAPLLLPAAAAPRPAARGAPASPQQLPGATARTPALAAGSRSVPAPAERQQMAQLHSATNCRLQVASHATYFNFESMERRSAPSSASTIGVQAVVQHCLHMEPGASRRHDARATQSSPRKTCEHIKQQWNSNTSQWQKVTPCAVRHTRHIAACTDGLRQAEARHAVLGIALYLS